MEAKRLSQSIVPGRNLCGSRKCRLSILDAALMDAEIVVRIFNKPIPRRAIPRRRLVLAFGLRALRRLCFDRLRGLWLRLVIFGGKIDRRYFRQGLLLLRLRAERFRDTDGLDRKSTRLNSSHVASSYAVFCLKKKK